MASRGKIIGSVSSIHRLLVLVVQVIGESFLGKLEGTKVLVVGAGGIGCELLKNLVVCGFKQITVVNGSFSALFIFRLILIPLMSQISIASFSSRSSTSAAPRPRLEHEISS